MSSDTQTGDLIATLPLDQDPTAEVTVSILGSDNVKVKITGDGTTARSVLAAAAKVLGVDLDLGRVGIVVDGASATPDTPVRDESLVAAAPNVANG